MNKRKMETLYWVFYFQTLISKHKNLLFLTNFIKEKYVGCQLTSAENMLVSALFWPPKMIATCSSAAGIHLKRWSYTYILYKFDTFMPIRYPNNRKFGLPALAFLLSKFSKKFQITGTFFGELANYFLSLQRTINKKNIEKI